MFFDSTRKVIFLLLLIFISTSIDDGYCSDVKSVTQRPWRDEVIVKDAIVSYLTLREKFPKVSNDAEFYSRMVDLLLLFDKFNSQPALKTLVSLNSYYLGAHGTEVYYCLQVQKGDVLKPLLIEFLNSGMNECEQSLGKKSKYCRNNLRLEHFISSVLKGIEEKEVCIIEP